MDSEPGQCENVRVPFSVKNNLQEQLEKHYAQSSNIGCRESGKCLKPNTGSSLEAGAKSRSFAFRHHSASKVQLALHKKDRSKGSKKVFCQNQKKCRDVAPVQITAWKNQPAEKMKEGNSRGVSVNQPFALSGPPRSFMLGRSTVVQSTGVPGKDLTQSCMQSNSENVPHQYPSDSGSPQSLTFTGGGRVVKLAAQEENHVQVVWPKSQPKSVDSFGAKPVDHALNVHSNQSFTPLPPQETRQNVGTAASESTAATPRCAIFGPSSSPSMGTGSPDFSGVADYDKLAHQICDLIVTVPARVWDSTLGPNSIELKRLLAKRARFKASRATVSDLDSSQPLSSAVLKPPCLPGSLLASASDEPLVPSSTASPLASFTTPPVVPLATPTAASSSVPVANLPRSTSSTPNVAGKSCDSNTFAGPYPHDFKVEDTFHQVFGLKRFRPNQREAVNAALLGHDCFILMPTGGGKSICYQLPACVSTGLTVVVSPLRSLIKDQLQKLESLGICCGQLTGDIPLPEEQRMYRDMNPCNPEMKLLYVTPEKLSASNKLQSALTQLASFKMLSRFVIDEAHCISQWGHDFRPDYKRLSQLPEKFPGVPIMALTATATPRVQTDILHQLRIKDPKWFIQSFNRPNLKYYVRVKRPKGIVQDIGDLISLRYKDQCGIVYCLSRRDCEVMSDALWQDHQIAACAYHGGMSDTERAEVQLRWATNDSCKVMCATIAFGMGIDKPDVRFVIHHSLPKSVEGYYQESGRAGRDGLPADCILFYHYSDVTRIRRMVKKEGTWEQQKVHIDNLYRMVQYCENQVDCRRAQLLEYFAEKFDRSVCKAQPETACDSCENSTCYQQLDVTELARLVVRSVQQVTTSRNQFTMLHFVELLRGSASSKVRELGHTTLPLYARGKNHTKTDLERLMHLLVVRGILAEDVQIGNHDNAISYVILGLQAKGFLQGSSECITLHVKSSTTKTGSKTSSPMSIFKSDLTKAVYQQLLELRKEVATEKKVGVEAVFPVATLHEMARTLPQTKEEMLRVTGVTKNRWATSCGERFLQVLRGFDQAAVLDEFEGQSSSGGSAKERPKKRPYSSLAVSSASKRTKPTKR